MEEKSEALALCLFELQNSLLNLDAVSETINNCITVLTDKWRTWYRNQKCHSFVNLSWEVKWATSRSSVFIYMSALIFNLLFNLIWRIGFFFRSSVKNDFFLCHERAWNFLSIIMYFKTWNFDIDDLSSMRDDPLCIHCMSWLINEKSIVICENLWS